MSNEYSVLETPTSEYVTIPEPDASPNPDVVVPEYACEVCSAPLTYGGRGRKPRFCTEHKKNPTGKTANTNAANLKLAEKAADVLAQFNDFGVIGLMTANLPLSASKLAEKNPVFREQAVTALATDPALCKSILSAGTKSARGSLAFAYGLLAAAVGTSVFAELKERRQYA